jgi:uncharacterized repeat protein (TIGR01451 family)
VVNVRAAAQPSVTNTASVAGQEDDASDPNNNASDPTTVNGPSSGAEMTISKVDTPDPVGVGQTLTYTITAQNNGPDSATSVTVTDSVPAGLSISSATPSQGSCTVTGQDVSCDLGTLGAAEAGTVDIVVVPSAPGQVSNTAQVSSAVADPDPTNNASTAQTDVVNSADVSITKTHTGPFVVGTQGTYTISVSNAGPSDAVGPVSIADTLPAGLTYVSATGTGWACSATGQDVVCDYTGPFASGTSSDVTLVVDVGPAAEPSVTNTAQVSATTPDPDTRR